MNTLAATQANVTLPSAPATTGYPATALGALQKAWGAVFLTDRYMSTLSSDYIFRKACRVPAFVRRSDAEAAK